MSYKRFVVGAVVVGGLWYMATTPPPPPPDGSSPSGLGGLLGGLFGAASSGQAAGAAGGVGLPGVSDIPPDYLAAYRASGSMCPGLDWAVLAGIGSVESSHGRSALPGVRSGQNSAGAMGPMQFLGSTWDGVRARHPDIGPDIYNPADEIPAAAHKLCDDGIGSDPHAAILAYNHSDAYVADVLARAAAYRASAGR